MEILAGDWNSGLNAKFKTSFSGKPKELLIQKSTFSFDHLPIDQISEAEILTEDNHMKVGSKIGWGIAGALLLGPVGAAIGAVAGGNAKHRVVAIRFKDGRKLIVKAKKKDADTLLAIGYKWDAERS